MEAVIFIGIQASGKSTFYQERFFKTHVRINLDMLKTRRREDILLDACLQARQPFVVDNTNVLRREREKYIQIAKAAGFYIIGYYFETSLPDALRRNRQRGGKEFIPEVGVRAKSHLLEVPNPAEGFDQLYRVFIGPNGGFAVREWADDSR